MMGDTPLTLWQKLARVQAAIPYLRKDGEQTKGGRFNYVSSAAVLKTIRAQMDAEGLLLTANIVEERLHINAAYSGAQHLTELVIEFTWINVDNPEETLTSRWYGQGIDTGEKGVGKALTYAEKYYLLKTFHIPTGDADDPDAVAPPVARVAEDDEPFGDEAAPRCPKCGGEMRRRTRRDGSGEFWGCVNYPECKGTVHISGTKAQPLLSREPRVVDSPSLLSAVWKLGIEDETEIKRLVNAASERLWGAPMSSLDTTTLVPDRWRELYDEVVRGLEEEA